MQLRALYAIGTLLHLPLVYLPYRQELPVAALWSQLNIKHALTQIQSCKGEKKGEEVGKLLRRQIPPLFDALMLIHSERTSCLSAYTSAFLCFRHSFTLILLYCFLQFFLFSALSSSYPAFMLSLSFFQFTSFCLLLSLGIPSFRICNCTLLSSCNMNSRLKADRMPFFARLIRYFWKHLSSLSSTRKGHFRSQTTELLQNCF